jgi:cholest-4-en-3-one 26-monooxygenase
VVQHVDRLRGCRVSSESGSPLETRQEGIRGLGSYTAKLAFERRGVDGEDLLSVLGNAKMGDRNLTNDELFHNGWLYIVGGLETTRNAISGGLLALMEHPAERQRLANGAVPLPAAIEEILGWSSPVTHIARVATRDTELGGRKIREGEQVALRMPSANRYDAIFDNPYRFDLGHSPNEQIAFGKGEHFCVGAHLARLELRLMLKALLTRIDHIELAGKVDRLKSNVIAGIKHMPVRFTQTRAVEPRAS